MGKCRQRGNERHEQQNSCEFHFCFPHEREALDRGKAAEDLREENRKTRAEYGQG